jgi:hypothetical protein
MLLEKLPVLTKYIQLSKLKEFMEGDFFQPFVDLKMVPGSPGGSAEPEQLCNSAMRGLLAALRVPDPPQMISMLLYQTVEAIYDKMPTQLNVSR